MGVSAGWIQWSFSTYWMPAGKYFIFPSLLLMSITVFGLKSRREAELVQKESARYRLPVE